MAVPARLRHIKDNETTAKFMVLDEADKLYEHCINCCGAKAVKDNEEYSHLGKKIVKTALEIYTLCFYANSVPFYKDTMTEENFRERAKSQLQAFKLCITLQAFINLGRRHFQWRKKKINYWCGLCDKLKDLIYKWYLKTIEIYEDSTNKAS